MFGLAGKSSRKPAFREIVCQSSDWEGHFRPKPVVGQRSEFHKVIFFGNYFVDPTIMSVALRLYVYRGCRIPCASSISNKIHCSLTHRRRDDKRITRVALHHESGITVAGKNPLPLCTFHLLSIVSARLAEEIRFCGVKPPYYRFFRLLKIQATLRLRSQPLKIERQPTDHRESRERVSRGVAVVCPPSVGKARRGEGGGGAVNRDEDGKRARGWKVRRYRALASKASWRCAGATACKSSATGSSRPKPRARALRRALTRNDADAHVNVKRGVNVGNTCRASNPWLVVISTVSRVQPLFACSRRRRLVASRSLIEPFRGVTILDDCYIAEIPTSHWVIRFLLVMRSLNFANFSSSPDPTLIKFYEFLFENHFICELCNLRYLGELFRIISVIRIF